MAEKYVPATEIERAELAIAELLRQRLPSTSVKVDVCPDDPSTYDMAGAPTAVLVHFAETRPAPAAGKRLGGPVGFAIIVMSKSARGADGGYLMLERAEQALSGTALPNMRAITVRRTRLDSQSGGLWRWVIEIETEMVRGRPVMTPHIPEEQG